MQPSVREWDAVIRLAHGREVRLSGAETVSGRIIARDTRSGEEHIVADAGDYVYPADVRTSAEFERVYVKADGLAGGLSDQTWLFEYDLLGYRELAKVRVDPAVLPPECAGGPSSP